MKKPAPIYRVVNWPKEYEGPRGNAPFVFLPVSTDPEHLPGYIKLVGHRKGAQYLGAWMAILMVAANKFPTGVLINSRGNGLTSVALSQATNLPAKLFDEAIPFLLNELKWIEEISRIDVTAIIENIKAKRR